MPKLNISDVLIERMKKSSKKRKNIYEIRLSILPTLILSLNGSFIIFNRATKLIKLRINKYAIVM